MEARICCKVKKPLFEAFEEDVDVDDDVGYAAACCFAASAAAAAFASFFAAIFASSSFPRACLSFEDFARLVGFEADVTWTEAH